MKVTVQSVAERAQVSVGTVSRVLNDDPSVSPGLSSRVRQTIQDLGYKPLRKRKTRAEGEGLAGKMLGLVTIGMDRSLSKLPVVTEAIDGIVKAASDAEAGVQIIDVPDPGADPVWLKRARFDGWLIKGAMQGKLWEATHPELRSVLERRPCVWFHGRPRSAPGCGVGANDWEVGALAATHFAEAGHQEVAFLSPKSDHALLKRRQHGFVAQCEELGLECLVVSRNLQSWTFPLEKAKSLQAVDSLLGKLLDQGRRRPSAIFVPADSIAVLLYHALAKRGLSIPDDISVISANHEIGLIAGLFPALTTVDIQSELIGKEAVRLLSRNFEGESEVAIQDVQIDPFLEGGDSVAQLS